MKFPKIFTVVVAVICLFFLSAGEASGQVIIGGSLGANYSNLMGLDNTTWKIGGNARTILGYRFSPGFALHLEPSATLKGAKWQYDIPSAYYPDADTLIDVHKRNYTLYYLDVPLMAVVSFPLKQEGIIPYDATREQDAWLDVYLGPVFSLNFGGTVVETREEYLPDDNGDPTIATNESEPLLIAPYHHLNWMDFGVAAGIGVRFYLSNRVRFISDLRYTAGLLTADYGAFQEGDMAYISELEEKDQPDGAVNATNHVVSWNVGLLLEFRKRR